MIITIANPLLIFSLLLSQKGIQDRVGLLYFLLINQVINRLMIDRIHLPSSMY